LNAAVAGEIIGHARRAASREVGWRADYGHSHGPVHPNGDNVRGGPVFWADPGHLRAFLKAFGALDQDLAYRGSPRSGYVEPPGAATQSGMLHSPLVPLATKARTAFLDRAPADKTLVGSCFGHVVREESG
jgi:hypothetical protein